MTSAKVRLPVSTYKVDHEVVAVDLFEDADGRPVSAADLVALVNKLRVKLRPIGDYHEDYGQVLWYRLPICEPPFVSCPNSSDWLLETVDGACVSADSVGLGRVRLIPENEIRGPWATHWVPLPDVEEP